MSIEESIARDLVAILFVTFLFGGGVLWLVVATVSEQWRKARVGERNAALKQAMVEQGYRADEITRVLNAGGDELTAIASCVQHSRDFIGAVSLFDHGLLERGISLSHSASRHCSDTVATTSHKTPPPKRKVTNRIATRSRAMDSSIDMGHPVGGSDQRFADRSLIFVFFLEHCQFHPRPKVRRSPPATPPPLHTRRFFKRFWGKKIKSCT